MEKNPEPAALGFPCFTKTLPSQIRVSSGEKSLIPARTRMQTIINISRKRFLIPELYISDFFLQIKLLVSLYSTKKTGTKIVPVILAYMHTYNLVKQGNYYIKGISLHSGRPVWRGFPFHH
jgi:hypothetical protein